MNRSYVIAEAIEHGWCDETATVTFKPSADLPPMQPGDSVRVTLKADGLFDVVLVRPSAAAREAWGAEMWVDAPEQENDR